MLAAVTFAWLLALRDHAHFMIFQERDLARAELLAQGHAIFFGPEASGGGHLPGGFYYLLLALPLKLGLGWQGCWAWMSLLGATSIGMTWTFLRRHFSLEAAMISTIFLLGLHQFYLFFMFFENPSFLPFFLTVSLLALPLIFARAEGRRGTAWIAACLCFGLGMQIHFTIAFVFAAALFLQWRAEKLGLFRLPWRTFFLGLGVLLLTLAPFAVWCLADIMNIHLGQLAPVYSGEVGMSFATQTRALKVFLGLHSNRPVEFEPLLRLLNWPLLWILLLVGLFPAAVAIENKKQGDFASRTRRIWLLCTVFACLPAAGVLAHPNRSRYFLILAFCLPLVISTWMDGRWRERLMRHGAMIFGLAFAALIFTPVSRKFWLGPWDMPALHLTALQWTSAAAALLGVYFLRGTQFKNWAYLGLLAALPFLTWAGHFDLLGVDIVQAQAFSEAIYQRTGWPWETASERIFFIHADYQRTPSVIYRDVASRPLPQRPDAAQIPDGFIVALTGDRRVARSNRFRHWLLRQHLPELLENGLREGQLTLEPPKLLRQGLLVVGYHVRDRDTFPGHFQNSGVPYLAGREQAHEGVAQASERLGPNHFAFTFNDCPSKMKFCETRIEVHTTPDSKHLDVRLTSDLLAQASSWISPDWNQNLFRPYLELTCEAGGEPTRLVLIDHIGFNKRARFSHDMTSGLLAPFERSFPNPCADGIKRLTAGYKNSFAFVRRRYYRLPGRQESIDTALTESRNDP